MLFIRQLCIQMSSELTKWTYWLNSKFDRISRLGLDGQIFGWAGLLFEATTMRWTGLELILWMGLDFRRTQERQHVSKTFKYALFYHKSLGKFLMCVQIYPQILHIPRKARSTLNYCLKTSIGSTHFSSYNVAHVQAVDHWTPWPDSMLKSKFTIIPFIWFSSTASIQRSLLQANGTKCRLNITYVYVRFLGMSGGAHRLFVTQKNASVERMKARLLYCDGQGDRIKKFVMLNAWAIAKPAAHTVAPGRRGTGVHPGKVFRIFLAQRAGTVQNMIFTVLFVAFFHELAHNVPPALKTVPALLSPHEAYDFKFPRNSNSKASLALRGTGLYMHRHVTMALKWW